MNKVPGAILNPKTKLWAVPYENKQVFESIMGNHLILWRGEESTPGGIDENTIPPYPVINYQFKTTPFDYQIKGFNAIFQRDFLILADEMGLGKSLQVITAIDAKKQAGMLKRGVIVCKASLLYNWRDEVEKHSNLKAVVITGTPTQRAKLFSDLKYSDDWTFLIISYETFRISIKTLDLMDNLIGLDFIVIDEAQKIKNPQSQIGRVMHEIPFKYKYLLTGTPLPNTPLEAYNYLKLGGKINMNWWQFRHRYAIMGGYAGKEVVGYKNIKELKDLIHQNMLRRLKKDKLKELPDIMFNTITIEMNKGQRALYEAVKKEILEDLQDTTLQSIPTALAKLTRLQQVTDAPELIGSKEKSVKLEALDELLEDIIDEGGKKAIIFSRFRTMVEIVYNRYKKYNPAMIYGDIDSQGKPRHIAEKIVTEKYPRAVGEEREKLIQNLMTSDRQKEVYKFQNDNSCKLFIGCAPACREGLTLTAASYVIFIDTEWSPSYVQQAYSRAYRIGQKDCVNVYYLVCKDSIDEKVQKVLERKDLMAQTIIDNGVKATSATRAKEFIEMMVS
jgi:SNF2 family DNA or RNA helicase